VSDSQQGRVQAQFGPSAAAYVTSAGHAAGPDLEWLLAWGRKRGAARVLDIATGGGHTALAFSRFTESVVAMDVTLPMLEAARRFIAREGAAVRFVGGDVETLPFRDATFGTVTCRIAAHHFPALLPALRQVARVLRAGGTFLIQDILGHDDQDAAAFIREVERRRDPSHVRAYRLTPGMAHVYNEGDVHSPRRDGPTRLIRIEGRNMDKVGRASFTKVS